MAGGQGSAGGPGECVARSVLLLCKREQPALISAFPAPERALCAAPAVARAGSQALAARQPCFPPSLPAASVCLICESIRNAVLEKAV